MAKRATTVISKTNSSYKQYEARGNKKYDHMTTPTHGRSFQNRASKLDFPTARFYASQSRFTSFLVCVVSSAS